jgi:hypothetical protein
LTPDPARLIALSLGDLASVRVSLAAYKAIRQRVEEDTAPGTGAPAEARATEEDAMLCGYRFGQLVLGPLALRQPVSSAELWRRTDSMHLYALLAWTAPAPVGRVPVEVILARHGAGHILALEEAVTWAWAFGLGLALVEADPGTRLRKSPHDPHRPAPPAYPAQPNCLLHRAI